MGFKGLGNRTLLFSQFPEKACGDIMIDVPHKNEFGYYEIRMEAIGGMGANLAGKMLTEAAVIHMGMNGATFSSYGSEKTGTPLKAFIRLCRGDQEIEIGGPVMEPHLLVVFHTILKKVLPVTSGLLKDGIVIVNSDMTPSEAKEYFNLPGGHIYTIDGWKIVVEENVRINTVIMGSVAKASGFITADACKKAISTGLGKKVSKAVLEANIKGFDRGMSEMKYEHFQWPDNLEKIPIAVSKQDIGYENAPIGGVIVNPGNTIGRDVSGSRTGKIPVWNVEKCIHCGMCELACPDFCFTFELDTKDGKELMFNRGIDYQYCKGCLKCVSVCPKEALTVGVEAEHDLAKITHKKKF